MKSNLIICGGKKAEELLNTEEVFDVISIAAWGTKPWGHKDHKPTNLGKANRFINFSFDDIRDDTKVSLEEPPTERDVKRAIAFARLIKFGTQFQKNRLIVHCHAGMSRSTAIAFVICCWAMGPNNEMAALDKIFRSGVGQEMCPNELIVALGDKILKRNGAMIRLV